MGRVSETDLGAVFGFLAVARAGASSDPIPVATLVALRDLLRADVAEYFELARSDRAVIGLAESDCLPTAPAVTRRCTRSVTRIR
jgi:hypothetical protein